MFFLLNKGDLNPLFVAFLKMIFKCYKNIVYHLKIYQLIDNCRAMGYQALLIIFNRFGCVTKVLNSFPILSKIMKLIENIKNI